MLRLLPRKPVRIDLSDQAELDRTMSLRRRHILQQILELNPTASGDFLDQFEEPALEQYLQHLTVAHQPRGKGSRWVRPHGKPWAFSAAACA